MLYHEVKTQRSKLKHGIYLMFNQIVENVDIFPVRIAFHIFTYASYFPWSVRIGIGNPSIFGSEDFLFLEGFKFIFTTNSMTGFRELYYPGIWYAEIEGSVFYLYRCFVWFFQLSIRLGFIFFCLEKQIIKSKNSKSLSYKK